MVGAVQGVRRRVAACGVGVGVCCLGAVALGAPPAVSVTAGEQTGVIAFQLNSSGYNELYLVEADGSPVTRLTRTRRRRSDASGNTTPDWSPDGSRIAFTSSGRALTESDYRLEIYTIGSDGRGLRRLTTNRRVDADPAWSSDGQAIAWTRSRGRRSSFRLAIYVMRADGTDARRLTSGEHLDGSPTWSPDGGQIAFDRYTLRRHGGELIPSPPSIWVMNADGSGERRLGEGATPAWSPDGTRIAFTSQRDRNGRICFHDCTVAGEIYVMGADGSDPRRLTDDPAGDCCPDWSPGGNRIAFASTRDDREDHTSEIYLMDSVGFCQVRVTQYTPRRDAAAPSWRPEPPGSPDESPVCALAAG